MITTTLRSTRVRLIILLAAWLLAALAGAGPAPEARPLTPLPTPRAPLRLPVNPTQFRFAVGGDNRATGHGDPMPPALGEICREIGLIRPDFVLWSGDAIFGYDDTPEEAAAEYGAFLEKAALCETPVFNVPGNHELGNGHFAELQAVYRERMGPLYGSFDYGDGHFIGLDTTPVIDGKACPGELDPAQRAWLETDLAAHAGRQLFVFMHHYVFGPPDPEANTGLDTGLRSIAIRDDLHRLFREHRVRAVFCGHAHLFWHRVKDGIDYFIAGNAGAPLVAPPEEGGFLGYIVVEVDGASITTRALQPWTLLTRQVRGGDGRSPNATVDVSNYTAAPLSVRGITLRMPARTTYRATASATYKRASRLVPVTILNSASETGGGAVTLTLGAELPSGRTTRIEVAPAGAAE